MHRATIDCENSSLPRLAISEEFAREMVKGFREAHQAELKMLPEAENLLESNAPALLQGEDQDGNQQQHHGVRDEVVVSEFHIFQLHCRQEVGKHDCNAAARVGHQALHYPFFLAFGFRLLHDV